MTVYEAECAVIEAVTVLRGIPMYFGFPYASDDGSDVPTTTNRLWRQQMEVMYAALDALDAVVKEDLKQMEAESEKALSVPVDTVHGTGGEEPLLKDPEGQAAIDKYEAEAEAEPETRPGREEAVRVRPWPYGG